MDDSDEFRRWDDVAQTVLQTGFGATIAGAAIAVALTSSSALRISLVAASILSGTAAMVATIGLTYSELYDAADELEARKWLCMTWSLYLLRGGLLVATLAAGIVLVR